jgi:DNA polymerase III gamma/tau subunit
LLANHVGSANYEQIMQVSDEFSGQGIDFYRALLDLSEVFRELLLVSLREKTGEHEVRPEQCVRILDALREGEDLVKMGLSEKTNFEVTLFRAVEAGRSRSIDQVIRRISGMIPDEVKKKRTSPPDDSASTPLGEPEFSSPTEPLPVSEKRTEEESLDSAEDLPSSDEPSPDEPTVDEGVPPKDVGQADVSGDPHQTEKKSPRQIKDSKLIEKRISALPDGIRRIMEEKFQGDFVSIEKIDTKKLI